ncbi:MAG: hypothetical protein QOH21_454 [Acidobacteriota bacterium]|jgi:hypothetical protein|nr:hypothetical protein [Acidobacteriota bacterium]
MSDESNNNTVKETLKGWGIDLEQFEARAKQSVGTAKGDLTEITGTLRETLLRAKEVIMDLQKSGVTPVASELKTGFERAWAEIESAFAAARQRGKEARQPAEAAAPEATAEVTPASTDDPAGDLPDDPAI